MQSWEKKGKKKERKRQENVPWITQWIQRLFFFVRFFFFFFSDWKKIIEAECKEAYGEVQCFKVCHLITHEWGTDLHFPAHCCTSHLITPSQVQPFEQFPGVRWVYTELVEDMLTRICGECFFFPHSAEQEHGNVAYRPIDSSSVKCIQVFTHTVYVYSLMTVHYTKCYFIYY